MNAAVEYLLVAGESSDPFTTSVFDPKTGSSVWSLKGSELQGAITGCVQPLGENGDFLVIAAKNKPLLHTIAVRSGDRFHVKSVLSGPLSNVAVSSDGAALFGTSGPNLFTWMVGTGELLSVVNAHYQPVSCIRVSSDDRLLISGGEDGTVKVFLVADLMSWELGGIEGVKPFREWRPHSLKVKDVCVTHLCNARVLSCSDDHTAAFYSVSMNECLVKISGDRALTCCVIDPAESRLFLGTDTGSILPINLYSLEGKSERIITTAPGTVEIFSGHNAEVRRLDVNHDASMLASGDAGGLCCIWDITSCQRLRVFNAKGSICTLRFVLNWTSVRELDKPNKMTPLPTLQRSRLDASAPKKIVLCGKKRSDGPADAGLSIEEMDKLIADLLHNRPTAGVGIDLVKRHRQENNTGEEINAEQSRIRVPSESDSVVMEEEETVEALKRRVAELTKVNKEIYTFAASLVLRDE